jgi:hypothetical protein
MEVEDLQKVRLWSHFTVDVDVFRDQFSCIQIAKCRCLTLMPIDKYKTNGVL